MIGIASLMTDHCVPALPTAGSVKRNVDPSPGSESTQMSPPWRSSHETGYESIANVGVALDAELDARSLLHPPVAVGVTPAGRPDGTTALASEHHALPPTTGFA
ncbi:hypothetical protein BRD03_11950 [Halobacteriales archaeon QS_9_68_17]|nr:MAG: hypothetical protein BRD03_11950 [Halobacteriales archaeon QS_9_68_17]